MSEKNKLLSIIVPVYNAEKYIKQCMDSLLEQDINKDEYEIICINDGSKDNSLVVLQEYAKNNSNVLVVDKENGGVSKARNTGLDIAKGEYVWFVDADDWIARNCLGSIREHLLERKPDSLQISYTWIKAEWRIKQYENYEFEREKVTYKEGEKTSPYTWSTLMKREIIEKSKIRFLESLRYGEDGLFMWEVADAIRLNEENGGEREEMEGESYIYYYRQHDASAMGQNWTKHRKEYAESLLIRARINKERAEKAGMPAWYTAQYENRFAKRITDYLLHWLPGIQVDAKATINELEKEGLYPYRPTSKSIKAELFKGKGLKGRLIDVYQSCALKWKWLYLIYYKQMSKKMRK